MSFGKAMESALSHGQRALWFLHRLAPASGAYHIAAAARFTPALDGGSLGRALAGLVRRHGALRTTFHAEGGEPRQRVGCADCFELLEIEASALSGSELAGELVRTAYRPFDLETGPLWRAALFHRPGGGNVLLLVVHHIVADFWSMAVAYRELGILYRREAGDGDGRLPPLPMSYTDHVRREAERLAGEEGEALRAFWHRELVPPPRFELDADRPRPPIQTYRGAAGFLPLGTELLRALGALARARGTTLLILFLAAWKSLLYRMSGQRDLAVGTPTTGRHRRELAGLVGYFVNPVVVRTRVAPRASFAGYLAEVTARARAAFEHQEYPFALLAEEIGAGHDPSRSPLFQVSFVYQKARRRQEKKLTAFALGVGGVSMDLEGLRVESLPLGEPFSQFDLTLRMAEVDGSLSASLQHNTDLFDATTAGRILGHLRKLLLGVAAQPEGRVAEMDLLSRAERTQLLREWAADGGAFAEPAAGLHELFAAQAARAPAATALVDGEARTSYGELERRANGLARALRRLGVGPEVRVGVALPRSAELVQSLLAVWKAGGAYVPLDPAYPRHRLELMLEDSAVRVLLVRAPFPTGLRKRGIACVDPAAGGRESGGPLTSAAGPRHLAYVIYTSGSSGRPKGVAIEHRGAAALVRWARESFSAAELAGVLASTSISFDLSVFELFAPLAGGGRVVLARDVLDLPGLAARGEVTLVNTVPSALAALLSESVTAGDAAAALPVTVRTVNLAGEPLTPALVEQIYRRSRVGRVWNLYGPSEDTTYSTAARVAKGARRVTIGRAAAGSRTFVLSPDARPLPIGATGELHLGGRGLARGYLGRPALTAERFVPDPFAGERAPSSRPPAGERLYRTGDRVRWLAHGELEFLGRFDRQLKVRGFRIEPEEVETVLARCPGVREAAVEARHGRLVAFVAGSGASPDELRRALERGLPEYMVPSAFELVESLPRLANGKVDRTALSRRPLAGREGHGRAPGTVTEELIAGIWGELLGRPGLGVHDHFFELGGHSLLATRAISRVRSVFGVELPVRALFEAPRLGAFARRVEAARGAGRGVAEPPPEPRDRRADAPLSFSQMRLFFLDRWDPGTPAYNLSFLIRMRGAPHLAALDGALSSLLRRHEVLRTRFEERGAEAVQVVEEVAEAPVSRVDLRAIPAARRAAEAGRIRSRAAERSFRLERLPLWQVLLVQLGESAWRLVFTIHHVIIDGWSFGLLFRDLAGAYGALAAGRPVPRDEPPLQYADYAVWQRRQLRGEALETRIGHWRETLGDGGSPLLELPADRPRPARASLAGGRRRFRLGRRLSDGLAELGRRSGATLYMVLLAALGALLHRSTSQTDVSVGTYTAGRQREELEGILGFFVNTLALRLDLAGRPAFGELLGRARRTCLGAYAHQEVPFEKLLEELSPARDASRTPFFQVVLVLQNLPAIRFELPALELELEPGGGPVWAHFDLTWWVSESPAGLEVDLDFRRDLFEAATAERLAARFTQLLTGAVEDPGRRLAELRLLSAAEEHQLLVAWNRHSPARTPPELLVHELVARQAGQRPEAVALVSGESRLTYRELDRRGERLARLLRARGVGPEAVVGIELRRSVEMGVALLGVLKAGGAYLPLDPQAPRERRQAMVRDSGAALVLAGESPAGPGAGRGPAPGRISGEHLAYLIYTSGSTGRPKAVAVSHGALLHHTWDAAASYGLGPSDRLLQFASLSFDASVEEIFPAWVAGAQLVLRGAGAAGSPAELLDDCRRRSITVLPLPTAYWHEMAAVFAELPAALELLIIGGEKARPDRVEDWRKAAPPVRLVNTYGPTEATVVTTRCELGPGIDAELEVPIGSPIGNVRVYVVDRGFRPAGIGVPGELAIAGPGLARGYRGRPGATAQRFVPDPFAARPGARLYRSGDRARHRGDGRLECLGRLDRQVKIRGYRIEPGEIEAALLEHPSLAEAVVVARREPGEPEARLVAYQVCGNGAPPSSGELLAHLRERLPEYMVPAFFVALEKLPKTAAGKVDRRRLPAPERGRPELAQAYAAPRSPSEEELAALMSELLGIARVGIYDSFFDLGGHSLLAVQLLARIRETFQVDLPLRAIFETPDVASLAVAVEELILAELEALESAAMGGGAYGDENDVPTARSF